MTTRVLLLCTSPSFGGLEMHVRDYARWLARQHGVQVLLGVQKGGRLLQSLNELHAPAFSVARQPGKLPWQAARALAQFADRHGVDVIHAHDQRDLPLAALAKRASSARKLIVTRHMGIGASKRDPYHRFMYATIDRYITVSDWIAASARKLLPIEPERIVRIYPGVPAREPLESTAGEEHRFVVGMVARILPDKGQHLLVAAAQMLRHQGVPVELVLAGEVQDPAYMESLTTAAASHGVPLRYLGFVSGTGAVFAGLDVAVVATRNEAFGLATAEALHARLPVVAAASGATPEIINDRESGLLFESEDPVSLAQQLESLWRDPALRRRLADAGARRAAREFDAETQFGKVWAETRALLAPEPALRPPPAPA